MNRLVIRAMLGAAAGLIIGLVMALLRHFLPQDAFTPLWQAVAAGALGAAVFAWLSRAESGKKREP